MKIDWQLFHHLKSPLFCSLAPYLPRLSYEAEPGICFLMGSSE